MNGWETLVVERCGRCGTFTDRAELSVGFDACYYCDDCGVPVEAAAPPRAGGLDWRARAVAGAMLALTAAFPFAAFLSQL